MAEGLVNESLEHIFDFNGFITKHGETSVLNYHQFLFGDIKVTLDYVPHPAEELMGYIKPILGIN